MYLSYHGAVQTHKLLEKTDIVPGMTTFQQSTTTTQSVDIQPLCAEKMNYKHEIHELFEHFVKPVRAWMGLAESTASHPERLMRTGGHLCLRVLLCVWISH